MNTNTQQQGGLAPVSQFRSKHKDPSSEHTPGNMKIDFENELVQLLCLRHGPNIVLALVWFFCLLVPLVCFLFVFVSFS